MGVAGEEVWGLGGASLNWHRNDARELAVEFWIYVVAAAAAAALEASVASFAATAMRATRMWMRSTRRRRCVCKLEFVWAVPCGSSLATPTLTLFPAAKRGMRLMKFFPIFSAFSPTFFVGETSAEGCTGDVTRFQPLLRRQEFAVAVVASCRCSSRSFSLDTTAGDGGCCVDIEVSLAILAIRAQLMLSLRTTLDSSSRR